MGSLFGAFDDDGRSKLLGRNLAQSLREQIGQMRFEIQDSGHCFTPSKEARIITFGGYWVVYVLAARSTKRVSLAYPL